MKRLGFYLLLILVMFYCLAPILWQLMTSLKPDQELTVLPPILPKQPTLAHYKAIFQKYPFFRIMLNSGVVATGTTLLSLLLGSLAGFGLAKLKIPYKPLLMGLILSVSMFPPIATVSPLYLIIRALNLRDTWWSLILTHTSFSLPLSIWILTHFFNEIPREIYLSAIVDGCSTFQAFYRVMLPLASPGLVTTAILVFIFSWNEFLFALTFTVTSASRTIPVAIALFPGLHEIPWGDIAAASMVVILPVVFLVLIFQRRIVEGLTAGAVKG